MGRTMFAKLWDQHLVADLGAGTGLVLIDRILLHERTGGVALQSLAAAHRTVAHPAQAFATMDHVVDTRPGRTDDCLVPSGRDFIIVEYAVGCVRALDVEARLTLCAARTRSPPST